MLNEGVILTKPGGTAEAFAFVPVGDRGVFFLRSFGERMDNDA